MKKSVILVLLVSVLMVSILASSFVSAVPKKEDIKNENCHWYNPFSWTKCNNSKAPVDKAANKPEIPGIKSDTKKEVKKDDKNAKNDKKDNKPEAKKDAKKSKARMTAAVIKSKAHKHKNRK